MPSVSIIIPAYNSAAYLPQAIDSCLAQTFQDFELIVVDDGSTDGTRAVAAAYPRVRYSHQPNSGVAAARNAGWRQSSGEFLQWLDADDILLPTKLAASLAAFSPDVDVVYTDFEVRSADLAHPLPRPNPTDPPADGDILRPLVSQISSLFPPHAALTRRSAADRTRQFNEQLQVCEDWYFWIELAAHGARFKRLADALVWYRRTPASLSQDDLRMAKYRLRATEGLGSLPALPIDDLQPLIAARHFVYGMKLWKHGQRAAGRHELRQAIALGRGRSTTRVYFWMLTYLSSAERAERILQPFLRAKGTLPGGST